MATTLDRKRIITYVPRPFAKAARRHEDFDVHATLFGDSDSDSDSDTITENDSCHDSDTETESEAESAPPRSTSFFQDRRPSAAFLRAYQAMQAPDLSNKETVSLADP